MKNKKHKNLKTIPLLSPSAMAFSKNSSLFYLPKESLAIVVLELANLPPLL